MTTHYVPRTALSKNQHKLIRDLIQRVENGGVITADDMADTAIFVKSLATDCLGAMSLIRTDFRYLETAGDHKSSYTARAEERNGTNRKALAAMLRAAVEASLIIGTPKL